MSGHLLLFDGNACAIRLFYAVSPRLGQKGRFPSLPRSFLQLVLRHLKKERPDHVAVLWEEGQGIASGELALIQRLLKAAGVPLLQMRGLSVGQMALQLIRQAEGRGVSTTLITTRKSLLQLVQPSVTLIHLGRDELRFRPQQVELLFGVAPHLLPDWLALAGAKGERILGVPGIGPRGSARLILRYGSLEGVLRHAEELAPALKKRLQGALPRIQAGLQVARIQPFRGAALSLEVLRQKPPDPSVLLAEFSRCGVADLVPHLLPHLHPSPTRYETVLTQGQLDLLKERLREAIRFSIDTETTGLDPFRSDLVGISLALQPHEAFYIPIGHRAGGAPAQLTISEVAQVLRGPLLDPSKLKIGQNLKFDLAVLRQAGIPLREPLFDTLVASHLLFPDRKSHSLDALALDLVGYKMIPFEELVPEAKSIAEVEIPRAAEYACEDADLTLQLFERLSKPLENSLSARTFQEVEMPFLLALSEIETHGLMIGTGALQDLVDEAEARCRELAQELFALAGRPFRLDSAEELRQILEEELGATASRQTRTGEISLRRESLERLAAQRPLIRKVLEFQDFRRLLKGKLPWLTDRLDLQTRRLRVSVHPAATGTGRLGFSRLFQFRSGRTHPFDEKLRSLATAPAGSVLLEAVYLDVRKRLIAHWTDGGSSEGLLLRMKREGQVVTLLGRRRRLPELASPRAGLRKAAEREAIETLLEGSVSDLLKVSTLKVRSALQEAGLRSEICWILPDGFLLEVPKEEEDRVVQLLGKAMRQVLPLRVPLEVRIQ